MEREELLPLMSDDTKQYADRVLEVFGAPFAQHMGIKIESISSEEVICSMSIQPFMINSMGRVHGGAIYSLMDHTFAIISNMLHDGTGQSTEVKFYRPANGDLRCVAKAINVSRSLGIYDVRVYSQEGKLIASSTCTGFIIRKIE
jgi:acyl-CoA thioesterase